MCIVTALPIATLPRIAQCARDHFQNARPRNRLPNSALLMR